MYIYFPLFLEASFTVLFEMKMFLNSNAPTCAAISLAAAPLATCSCPAQPADTCRKRASSRFSVSVLVPAAAAGPAAPGRARPTANGELHSSIDTVCVAGLGFAWRGIQ